MKKTLLVIAVSLMVIAGNMTYSNIKNANAADSQPKATEEVVEVVGRYNVLFDGFGGNLGFLVKSRQGLEVVPYDQGSMADTLTEWRPKYLTLWRTPGKRDIVVPITVD